jgi:hypothetical protein
MKTGLNFSEFMAVAEKAEGLKRDYECRTEGIHAIYNAATVGLGLHLEAANQDFRLGPVAHDNLSTLAGIPRTYYQKMLQTHPKELAGLVEMHLHQDDGVPQERFVRTIGGKARALLSTKYGVLDHIDVAKMLDANLPQLGGVTRSILCTEKKLTFQYLFPKLEGTVNPKVGDVVQAGLAISNSEVGQGMFRVEALLFVLACTNGMIKPGKAEWKLERIHRGTPNMAVLQEYTRERLVALPAEFGKTIRMAQRADGVYIPEEELAATVERVRSSHQLTLPESDGVLESLYAEGRWTGWGLVNAVNFQAHSTKDNDRSVELERISGAVLDQYY